MHSEAEGDIKRQAQAKLSPKSKLMRFILRVIDGLNNVLAMLGSAIIAIMGVAICINSITRITGYYVSGILEFSQLALVFITFGGAAWLLNRDGHVAVNIITSKLSARVAAGLGVATGIINLIVFSAFGWYMVQISMFHLKTNYYLTYSSTYRLPQFPFEVIIPIGCFLLVIGILRKLYRRCIELGAKERG